jgi:acetyl-CoA C-acetyltransferase
VDENNIPVLVGCGQVTQREPDPARALAPMDLMADACRDAAADSGAGAALLGSLDTIAVLRSFSDTSWRFTCPFGRYENPPASLASRLNATAAQRLIYTHPGGNMPQYLMNRFSEQITRGETTAVLVAGGEARSTQKAAQRAGVALDWSESATSAPQEVGVATRGWSDMEERHRMAGAIFAYPLFENAIRGAAGRSVDEHLQAMGELFSRFAAVAAKNPLADRRTGYDARALATVGPDNPYIGFPYTKLMNANAFIDQSAAVILTSVGHARRLGIDSSKWVYLHGCADTYDHWHISDRINFHSSPAMRIAAREALEMAQCGIDDVEHFDLYSCFPSAVEIASAEMGIALDDPRGLTVTGGLPYFGGPGNNYVTHSIAEMMRRLRAHPDSLGMVTANGNYVTKQSVGLYSTRPPEKVFAPKDPKTYQGEIDAVRGPDVVEHAQGSATVETYTVMHDREGPTYSIVFGRLEDGRRFIANTPSDRRLLEDMTRDEFLGRSGVVSNADGVNTFSPA